MEEIAYHAAGRAIVACHLGIAPTRVALGPTKVVRPRTCSNPFAEAVYLAGGVACVAMLREKHGEPRDIDWSGEASLDAREIAALFAQLAETPHRFADGVERFRDGRVRAARVLLGRRWHEVVAVAAELLETRSIAGARLTELVDASPSACSR